MRTGPGFEQGVSRLLDQLKPTLSVFLANLSTIGQVGVVYHPAPEQILVLLPRPSRPTAPMASPIIRPVWRSACSRLRSPTRRRAGWVPAAVAVAFAGRHRARPILRTISTASCRRIHRYPCAARGTIPAWASPESALPQSKSAIATKSTRLSRRGNMRWGRIRWILNLLSQRLPPDDRVGIEQRTFGPADGTPLPPRAAPAGTPPGPPSPGSLDQPPTAPQAGAAPSAFGANDSGVSPSGRGAALRSAHGSVRCA